jgi:acetyl esterase
MPGNEATPGIGDSGRASAPVPSEAVRKYFLENPDDDTDGVSDIPLLRRQTREVGLRVRGELESIESSTDVLLNGVAARSYRPARLDRPGVGFIWIHGGGWMHGDLDVYDGVARAFANELGCEVISVDYGLAPEHPFPDGLNDVWAVVEWAAHEFDDVVVAGDSSGGNLVAAAAIMARDRGVRLAAQLLIYPVLDSSEATEFKQRFRTRYSPFVGQAEFGEKTYERITWIWDVYVSDPTLRESELATPMRAGSLRGLAPAVVVTAEHDILRGEAEAYAKRLREDAVPVELIDFPGQIHGFLQMRGILPEAVDALQAAAAAVGRYLPPRPARTAPLNPASISIERSSSRTSAKTKES